MSFNTDKVLQGYLSTYLQLAGEIGTGGRVCEVGVWQGGSLEMWQALFPNGIVAGIDADTEAVWPAGTVKILANQVDTSLPLMLKEISAEWDLIVDDASHLGRLTEHTWELLWPLVRPGGYYVIEDWFVGFGWHPAYKDDSSMLKMAQGLLECLNGLDGLGHDTDEIIYRYGMIIMHKRVKPQV